MSALVVDVLGTAVRIVAPVPIMAELRRSLADLELARGVGRELALTPGDDGFDLSDTGRVVRRGVDPDLAAATVVWRLNAIAAESTDHVLLHGACVAGPRGGGVLLVAGSGAGKSTLTAACVGAGLAYLSDELTAIDRRTGLVAPYARPLGVDGEQLVPASSLGPVAGSAAAPVALVFPRYEPGADTRLVQLDTGWALVALASHATNLAVLGGTALAWLAGLALACPAFQLTHADAEQAVAAIARAAEGPGQPGRPVEPAPVLDSVTDDSKTVAVGDSVAVLHEPSGKIHLLNPAAAAVWRRAAGVGDTCGTSSLVDAVVNGSASGEERSTAAATIDRLMRSGLLPAPPGA